MNIHGLNIMKAIVKCQVACMGMQAENAVRADRGAAPAYDEQAFRNEIQEMEHIYDVNRDWANQT